jgi:MFS transporter, DHA2 family, methylenomycin A resistance protein
MHGLSALATGGAFLPMTVLTSFVGPVGAGGAMAVTALTALLLEKVPAERAGVASGVLDAARQLGGALVADRSGFVSGPHTSLLIAAATVAVSVVATLSFGRTCVFRG